MVQFKQYYNLDVIISVGYRVKSQRGVEFRQWANKVLKQYILQGYAVNQKRLMDPYGISQYKLAKETGMPVSRIQDILHNRRKVTPDTSLRLGIYFGVSKKYVLNIQMDLDIRELKDAEKESIEKIVPISLTAAVL